jgi:hypothetical protein
MPQTRLRTRRKPMGGVLPQPDAERDQSASVGPRDNAAARALWREAMARAGTPALAELLDAEPEEG